MSALAARGGQAAPERASSRDIVVTTLLAATAVAWAAVPTGGAGRGTRPALILAAASAALSIARLAADRLAWRPRPARSAQLSAPTLTRQARSAWNVLGLVPWPQVMTVSVIVLEVAHPARPWHTVLLGMCLLAFLYALHLAEHQAGPASLAGQLPLAAAGLVVGALSAVAAGLGAGGPSWLAAAAAVAAVLAAALAVPF